MKRLATLLCLAIAPGLFAQSSDELNEYFQSTSHQIANFLKTKGETKIAVAFTGPPNFRTSSGEGFMQQLSEHLKARGITVVDQAAFAFLGKFQMVAGSAARLKAEAYVTETIFKGKEAVDAIPRFEQRFQDADKTDTGKRLALKLSGTIADLLGEPVPVQISTLISEKLLASTLGVTVAVGGQTGANRAAVVEQAITKPGIFTDPSGSVKASSTSPFSIEVFVANKIRKVNVRDGLGYLPLELGEEYLVQLRNHSVHDAVVELKVDGLSAFHFCEQRKGDKPTDPPAFRYFFVARGQRATAQGWFVNEKKSKAFLVAPLEESVAYQLGKTSKIGLITATFFASWKSGSPRPSDEPDGKKQVEFASFHGLPVDTSGFVGQGAPGTTIGRDIDTDVKAVTQRMTGVERATISLRYERPKKEE